VRSEPDFGVTAGTGVGDVVTFGLGFVVVVFAVVLAFGVAVDFVVVVFFDPLVFVFAGVWASVALETFEPVVLDALEPVAGVVVVTAGVVVALCAAEPEPESFLPHPAVASARASSIPVVAVSFRGTARTIAPGARSVGRT
jgi:hypothetical protein